MRVFVAGATGVIGRRVVARLVQAGHTVTAVARSASKAQQLTAMNATPVDVDLLDDDAVHAAVAGHDAVVNLATKIPSGVAATRRTAWAENDSLRSVASTHLVDAAFAAGTSVFVQESVCFGYVDRGAEWIDEDTTVALTSPIRSTSDAEANTARFAAAGGRGVVLRFAMLVAPDAAHTIDLLRLARLGRLAMAGAPERYQCTIHADDAAAAVLAAVERAPSGIYNVSDDDPLTVSEHASVLTVAIGRHVGMLPQGVRDAGGELTDLLRRSQRVSSAKLTEATGWRPAHPSMRDAWPEVVGRLGGRQASTGPITHLGLWLLAASALVIGVQALFAPRWFYNEFPLGRGWVAADGPFNQHLLRDFGALQLALFVVTVVAIVTRRVGLARLAGGATLVFALPHLVYHLGHRGSLGDADLISSLGALTITAAVAALTLFRPAS